MSELSSSGNHGREELKVTVEVMRMKKMMVKKMMMEIRMMTVMAKQTLTV